MSDISKVMTLATTEVILNLKGSHSKLDEIKC